MRLENKTAIVTGGAEGIGKAVVEAFANEGAVTYFLDINKEDGEKLEANLRADGRNVTFIKADVSLGEDAEKVVKRVMDERGRVDILVNNAAINYKYTIDALPEDKWDHIFAVNIKSLYHYCHRIVPIMAAQGGGSIINMGSVTCLIGVGDFPAYVASKTAMLGLTRALAVDHAHQNIRVNIICPSNVRTALMDWQFNAAPDPEAELKRVLDLHLTPRVIEPWEIAELTVYLASEKAEFITGSTFPVDGGYTTR